MSSFLDEEVPPVNPLGVEAIQDIAEVFLEQLAPDMLRTICPLDVLDLADIQLPKFDIHVSPACHEGGKALTEIHDELDPVHRSQLVFKCVPAK